MKIDGFEASEDTIRLIEDVFQQGDHRYNCVEDAQIVAHFLENKAIKISKKSIKRLKPSNEDLDSIPGPQKLYKFFITKLLGEKKYSLLGYEIAFCGGKIDMLAKDMSKNETIAIECQSCRIGKALDFLEPEKTVLWILSLSKGFMDEEIPLFIVRRGPNWDKYLEKYKKFMKEQIKKVKSPMDSLPS